MKKQNGSILMLSLVVLIFTMILLSYIISMQTRPAQIEVKEFAGVYSVVSETILPGGNTAHDHYHDTIAERAIFMDDEKRLCPKEDYDEKKEECEGGAGIYHEVRDGYYVRCPGGHWDNNDEFCSHNP